MPTSGASRPAIRGIEARRAAEFASFTDSRKRDMRYGRNAAASDDTPPSFVAFASSNDLPSMRTTPGLRPLAEPPLLDWEQFQREYMPPIIPYKALFPDDPETRSRMKGLTDEAGALIEYIPCVKASSDADNEVGSKRRTFFMALVKDITEDKGEVDEKDMALWVETGNLNKFEYHFLDDEGGTTRMEFLMEEGIDVFRGWAEETRRKYRHLIPEHFKPDPLKTFEFVLWDVMGSIEWLENV